jgi:anthranilate phosphoribosyltransferase
MPKPEWLSSDPISATNNKADTELFHYLIRLMRGENFHFEEAAEFFRTLTDRNANPSQIAGVLTALTAKGETALEIAGMLSEMYEQTVKIKTRYTNFINISGTGLSPVKTFNVSTAASFVVAGAGLPVAKHTDRALMSQSGGAEVLEKLGVKVSIEPKLAQACLDGAGICFLFSTKFHPLSRRIKDVSRSLGIKTCLHTLEALANPANAPKQIVGVWHQSLTNPVANALLLLKTERSWIVHGTDGLDELTLAGETFVTEITDNKLNAFKVTPEEFGLIRADIDHLKMKTPEESATIIKEVLEAKRHDEARSLIVLNAAAALMVGGLADNPKKAAILAQQSIDSRSALTKLERLIRVTNKK